MQLTGREIIEKGILTGVDLENAVQQQGVDVRVVQINRLEGVGRIPEVGKTQLPKYTPVPFEEGTSTWCLNPGYYEIILEEGCNMPQDAAMTFVQRSSLLRNGCIIRSSQFDAGFETNHMGTFMMVFNTVRIDYKARVAQAIVHETHPVFDEDLYDGQWQNDKQR